MIIGDATGNCSQISRQEEMTLKFSRGAESDRQEPAELPHRLSSRSLCNIRGNGHRCPCDLIAEAEAVAATQPVGRPMDVESKMVSSLPHIESSEVPHFPVIHEESGGF